jgi:RNA polymerase sigma factor (sigma-70 family)
LVESYSGLLWAIARGHGLNDSDASDVAQTTWMRLLENLTRIEQPERIGAWLATTARRECLRVLRNAKRGVLVDDQDERLHLSDPVDLPLESRLLAEERDEALARAYAMLPTRCRVLLVLLVAEPELSYKELSETLDMPCGSIGPTRGRCLEQLRRLAESVGLEAAG